MIQAVAKHAIYITPAHAHAYASFVADLATALHSRGNTLEMCVSSWSILTAFGLYAQTHVGVDAKSSARALRAAPLHRQLDGGMRADLEVAPHLRLGLGLDDAEPRLHRALGRAHGVKGEGLLFGAHHAQDLHAAAARTNEERKGAG